jgi:predicted transposase/invertase (TIGR01784 family)
LLRLCFVRQNVQKPRAVRPSAFFLSGKKNITNFVAKSSCMKSGKEKPEKKVQPANKAHADSKKERQLVSFDWAVKRLLRNKANFEVVEGFLSELLGSEIRITSVLESESNQTDKNDRQNRMDIVVEDTKGEIILIELQFIIEVDYFHRMLYGVSKAITERMFQGDEYGKVKKIYSINIVYFDLGHGKGYVYHGRTDFKNLYDKNDILHLSANQQKIFGCIEAGDIYPEYYIFRINKFNEVAKTTLDEWVYFLKTDRIEDGFKAKGLLKAREILDYERLSPKEKAIYDREQSAKNIIIDQIFSARFDGKTEGMEEGRKKGIEETEEKYAPVIEEKDKALEEQAQEIERLKRLIKQAGL